MTQVARQWKINIIYTWVCTYAHVSMHAVYLINTQWFFEMGRTSYGLLVKCKAAANAMVGLYAVYRTKRGDEEDF